MHANRNEDHLTVHAEYAALLRAHGLDSLEAIFAYSGGERLDKPGLAAWRSRFRITLPGGGSSTTLYLKRFDNPPRSERRAVRRAGSGAWSLAGNEWTWIERLTESGVACVQAAGFGEQLAGGRETRSALVTVAAPGRSLESWFRDWTAADRVTIRGLIPATAALAAKLHQSGYVHRDLYASHVFFDPTQSMERGLCLIDLQRVMRPTWRFSRWAVKDLASLNYSAPAVLVSRGDRVRWLRCYLGVARLGAEGKRLAYRVVGKSLAIARRDRRKV